MMGGGASSKKADPMSAMMAMMGPAMGGGSQKVAPAPVVHDAGNAAMLNSLMGMAMGGDDSMFNADKLGSMLNLVKRGGTDDEHKQAKGGKMERAKSIAKACAHK